MKSNGKSNGKKHSKPDKPKKVMLSLRMTAEEIAQFDKILETVSCIPSRHALVGMAVKIGYQVIISDPHVLLTVFEAQRDELVKRWRELLPPKSETSGD